MHAIGVIDMKINNLDKQLAKSDNEPKSTDKISTAKRFPLISCSICELILRAEKPYRK